MFLRLRRLLALYLDCIIIFGISYFPMYYIYTLFENMFMNIVTSIIAIILMVNLFLRKDCLIGYNSIGKKIVKLKIYQNDKMVNDKKLLIDRILYTVKSPIYSLFSLLLNNKTEGDIKCNTEIKSFRKNN